MQLATGSPKRSVAPDSRGSQLGGGGEGEPEALPLLHFRSVPRPLILVFVGDSLTGPLPLPGNSHFSELLMWMFLPSLAAAPSGSLVCLGSLISSKDPQCRNCSLSPRFLQFQPPEQCLTCDRNTVNMCAVSEERIPHKWWWISGCLILVYSQYHKTSWGLLTQNNILDSINITMLHVFFLGEGLATCFPPSEFETWPVSFTLTNFLYYSYTGGDDAPATPLGPFLASMVRMGTFVSCLSSMLNSTFPSNFPPCSCIFDAYSIFLSCII